MTKLLSLLFVVLLSGCANMDARQVLLGPTPLDSDTVNLDAYQAAQARASASRASVPSYVREGQAAAMTACTIWFKKISDYEEIGSLQMQEYNVLASLGMTAAGLAGANSVIVTALGAANTAVNSLGSINLRAAIAPSSSAVQDRVLATMNEQISIMEPNIPTMTYPQARIAIAQLARTCTPPVIRSLIAQALGATETTFSARGNMTTTSRSGQ